MSNRISADIGKNADRVPSREGIQDRSALSGHHMIGTRHLLETWSSSFTERNFMYSSQQQYILPKTPAGDRQSYGNEGAETGEKKHTQKKGKL